MPATMRAARKPQTAVIVTVILDKSALYRLDMGRYGLHKKEDEKRHRCLISIRECEKCCRC